MPSGFSQFTARLRDLFARDTFGTGRRPGLESEFNRLALDLFALQYRHNPPYRRLCEARKVRPENVGWWPEIPAVPTGAFKESDFTCLAEGRRTAVFHSSGTTRRRPSRHFHSGESLAVYGVSLWTWFRRHVLPDLPELSAFELVMLTPPPERAPHSSLVHMFDVVRRELRAPAAAFVGHAADDGTWVLDGAAVVGRLRKAAAAGRPVVLLGTAFSFVHLLEFLADRNLDFTLPPGSRLMETGGYKGRSRSFPKADLHALLSARLGISPARIVCEYGMSELSSQAYDRAIADKAGGESVSRAFVFPPWVRTRVISPETGRDADPGEGGLLRVFDLANVFSVMAVQTEDLAMSGERGFELLGRAGTAAPRGCSLMPA